MKPSLKNYQPANSALPPSPAHARIYPGSVAVVNDLAECSRFLINDDRHALWIPYGTHPHPAGLQIFDEQSAAILSSQLVSARNAGQRVAIYRGHPDVKGRRDTNPSAPALGWVDEIEVTKRGGRLRVTWNELGERALRQKEFRAYSPHWNCRPVAGGIQPAQLISIGLTNHPRIPVPALANDRTMNTAATAPRRLSETLDRAGNPKTSFRQAVAAQIREENALLETVRRICAELKRKRGTAHLPNTLDEWDSAFAMTRSRHPELFNQINQ